MLTLNAEIAADRMILEDQVYPLGHFVVEYLNRSDDIQLLEELTREHNVLFSVWKNIHYHKVTKAEFVDSRNRLMRCADLISGIPPFDSVKFSEARKMIAELFTEQSYDQMMEWQHDRMEAQKRDPKQFSHLQDTFLFHSPDCPAGMRITSDAKEVIGVLMLIVEDYLDLIDRCVMSMPWTFHPSKRYVSLYDRIDQSMGIMYFILEQPLLTDLYEGIRHNHYPRRCPSCGRVFLMETARRQKYCKGFAPMELTEGREILCSQWALRRESGLKKEFADADEANRIHTNVCGSIRKYRSLGRITKRQADEAKNIADEFLDRAVSDHPYAQGDYPVDMKLDSLLGRVGYVSRRKR